MADHDITPEEQLGYEQSLAKKAKIGVVLFTVTEAVFLIVFLMLSFFRSSAGLLLIILQITALVLGAAGNKQAKVLSVITHMFFAMVLIMTLADTNELDVVSQYETEFKILLWIMMGFSVICTAVVIKSKTIDAWFEYKNSYRKR